MRPEFAQSLPEPYTTYLTYLPYLPYVVGHRCFTI
jgi:hypothetical protein